MKNVALSLPERRLDFDRVDLDLLILYGLLARKAVGTLSIPCRGPPRGLLAKHILARSLEMLVRVLSRDAVAA